MVVTRQLERRPSREELKHKRIISAGSEIGGPPCLGPYTHFLHPDTHFLYQHFSYPQAHTSYPHTFSRTHTSRPPHLCTFPHPPLLLSSSFPSAPLPAPALASAAHDLEVNIKKSSLSHALSARAEPEALAAAGILRGTSTTIY